MQIEISLNENSLLEAIKRLQQAKDDFEAADRELTRAVISYDEIRHEIIPEIPDFAKRTER